MTPTYDLISSTTLASSSSSVSFFGIPATWRDLVLVITSTSSTTNDNALLRFNGDSGSNYSQVFMSGNGSVTASSSFTATSLGFSGAYWDMSNTTRDVKIVKIMDYSATDKHKTVLSRASLASESVNAIAGRWANTAAINQVTVIASFASGSTFNLYGIVS